jgi:hypothetical protein
LPVFSAVAHRLAVWPAKETGLGLTIPSPGDCGCDLGAAILSSIVSRISSPLP